MRLLSDELSVNSNPRGVCLVSCLSDPWEDRRFEFAAFWVTGDLEIVFIVATALLANRSFSKEIRTLFFTFIWVRRNNPMHHYSFKSIHDIHPLTIGNVLQIFCYTRNDKHELIVNSESKYRGQLQPLYSAMSRQNGNKALLQLATVLAGRCIIVIRDGGGIAANRINRGAARPINR